MNLNSKRYYIPFYRTILFGFCSLLIGFFTLWMLFLAIPNFDISDVFLMPVMGVISISTFYFGGRALLKFDRFIQLELQNDELRYLIIGKGKGAALNYFINPVYKTIKYSNIKFISILDENFEKRIQIIQNDGSKIVIPLLFQNEKELEEIVLEIKKN